MKVEPIGKRILVRKCTTGSYDERTRGHLIGGIALPDKLADRSHWAEVIAVSSDCQMFKPSSIGRFVSLPEWKPNDMNRISGDVFAVTERLFERGEAQPVLVEV